MWCYFCNILTQYPSYNTFVVQVTASNLRHFIHSHQNNVVSLHFSFILESTAWRLVECWVMFFFIYVLNNKHSSIAF